MKRTVKLFLTLAVLGCAALAHGASYTYVPISTALSPSATGYNQSGATEYFRINGSTVATYSNSGCAILGTTTTDNAPAGFVGEYISSTVLVATSYVGNGTVGDLASMTLSSGDWDVSGNIVASGNITGTEFFTGISITSGNSIPTVDVRFYHVAPTNAANSGVGIAPLRFSFAAPTTVYLKYYGAYTVGVPKAQGAIHARRVR